MEEMQTGLAPYLTGLVIVGALLFLLGLLIRILDATGTMAVMGNKIMGYGVVALLLALAFLAIMRVIEAWQSGVIKSIGT
jgi:hypothetical protein